MKCGGECGLFMLAPQSFFDARVRARERAFVADRPVGIGTLPGFCAGGKVRADGDSGDWRSGERLTSFPEAGVRGARRSRRGRRRAALISVKKSELWDRRRSVCSLLTVYCPIELNSLCIPNKNVFPSE